ncbi:MAG: nucleotidyltransferase family protein [Thermoleophilia bacterium]
MTLRQIDLDARLARVVTPPEMPISEAIQRLDRGGLGVLLLVRGDGTLAGLLTDGDLRRALINGDALTGPSEAIANHDPVVASPDISAADALRLMDTARSFEINQLPLVDADRRVTGLILRSDMVTQEELDLSAVVMAGGFGTRLRPLTADTPKPMLPIGGRPLMEHIIGQLQQAGVRTVSVATHFQHDKIADHFGDGHDFGVRIDYVSEDRPLGTAGALGLLERPTEPLLVINGDILTRVDFRSMLNFHRRQNAAFTVGVRRYDLEVPYGIVESEAAVVRTIVEKPHFEFLVNAGIYLLEPAVLDLIPRGQRFEMNDLIGRAIAEGQRVVSFPIVEYWLDIGRPGDYAKAQEDMENGRL